MNEVINILADRLEKQAGDLAILTADLAKLQRGSDKYYKWWTEEQGLTTKLEAKLKRWETSATEESWTLPDGLRNEVSG